MPTWRYSVGKKGVNRITVFERTDATCIFLEWWDDRGRHKRALKTELGHPVTDRTLAMRMARQMAQAQEQKRNQQAAELLGLPQPRTLKDLLERRHADLAPRWSAKYTKSRERRKAFWLDKLGAARLTAVSPAVVERIVREAKGERSDRWAQDVLRYIVDSFAYAEKKLRWIGPAHNLGAVEIPTPKGVSRAYTLAEAKRLLPALAEVHPVAGWLGVVAFQTGRRIGAVRQLTPGDVDGEVVTFPGSTDKARNTGQAVVVGLPARTDWRVPSYETCADWLRAAEERAGVAHLPGRGWHGLKRLYATLTTDMPGADRQSGTRRETLDGHYRQDVLAPKREVARQLSRYCPAENRRSLKVL